jgi:DNA-binding response OmpR family regulator
MCARCEELEDRVAWLESELGAQQSADLHERLRRALLRDSRGAPSRASLACRFIAALYAAHGRTMTVRQLFEAIPPKAGGEDERQDKLIHVWACHARKGLGTDAIQVTYGQGYRLSPAGMSRVAAILGEATSTRETA